MPRCCSNIFLNQFTQQPPDVIVDPPGASLCYHYEDVEPGGEWTVADPLTIDYVTINGVQTNINKSAVNNWGLIFGSGFDYGTVVTDLSAAALAAGVQGMGFYCTEFSINGFFAFRFSVTGENINSVSLTYSWDSGAGFVQNTIDLTGETCGVSSACFEAEYTPEDPFLIENATVTAVTNNGLTLFETLFYGNFCEYMAAPGWFTRFEAYIQCLHGSQSSVVLNIVGNTATIQIIDTLLVPAHMDNISDSGCTPPNSTPQVNNFTEISCP